MSAAAPAPRRPGPEEVYRLARRAYLAGDRLDLASFAAQVGVNRVTLYRWVGTKDQLMVEVVWRLTEQTLRAGWEALADEQGPRVPRLLADYLRATMRQPGARRVALEQNDRLMRLLTLAEHGFQPRLLTVVRDRLAEDRLEGRVRSSLSLDDLAYASVRIAESYYYLPTIAGRPADPDGAERVLTALMGGD